MPKISMATKIGKNSKKAMFLAAQLSGKVMTNHLSPNVAAQAALLASEYKFKLSESLSLARKMVLP